MRSLKRDTISICAIAAMPVLVAHPAHAQRYLDTLPASAYARAERFMQHRAADKMYRHRVDVRWLADGSRFWYSVETPDGTERYIVDPARDTKQLLVDRRLLAQGISAALDSVVEPRRLTLGEFELSKDEKQVSFNVGPKGLTCDLAAYRCSLGPARPRPDRGMRRSPDEKWDAFVRNNDIYIRQVGCTSGASCETRLTTDGSADWAYGRAGTFQSISVSRTGEPRIPMIVWSPDSKKMVVMRWDVRGVEKFYYISSTTIRPELFAVPQAIPSDSIVERHDLYVIDITDKSKIRVDTDQIPWVRGGMTEGAGSALFAQWAPTSDRFFFLSNDRGPNRLSLMTADAKTGAARRIASDTNTFRYGAISEYVVGSAIWRLSRGNDVYWYSERDGASHIYKYDSTGKLIGKVTEGPWNVTDASMDSTRSTLFVRGNGREPNAFKGHTKLYRMRPDGAGLALLTPETGDHTTTISPSGRYFVDTYSSINVPPVTVVRSTENGRVIRELERTDIVPSTALGWKPVELHTMTASDGAPLYVAVYKPTNFDSTRRYPVVDHIYPMPLGAIRGWGFIGPSSEQQALAELGFIVLQIQPRGVRDPSPAIRNYYRTHYQGRYAEATLADHVEAIKQLAARFSWIDLDKVGLYGTSGGGLSTTTGMLRYPDFFKVGVAFAGNHDDRSEQTIVGESWRGMLKQDSTGKDNYEGDANYLLVNNLRGKLMLVHGDLDEAVHPAMTTRVAAALIDAGKRFDMMVFPDQGHSSGGWYGSRLIFDYFVRNLMGYEVPDYTFTGVADPIATMRRRKLPSTVVP
jgi:dipeptidyl aminopeptidase/acylaminoacyl peptidase